MMRRLVTLSVLGLYFGIASCGEGNKYDGIFIISATPAQVAVVPIERRSCEDYYGDDPEAESVSSSSLGFSSFALSWREDKRDLYIVKIQLDLSGTVLNTKVDISDPDEIGPLFGIGTRNDNKIPRKGGAGATLEPNNTYRSDLKDLVAPIDGNMDPGQLSCPLAFGGINVPAETKSTVSGFIRVTAIAQDDANNQEVIRAEFPIKVIVDYD